MLDRRRSRENFLAKVRQRFEGVKTPFFLFEEILERADRFDELSNRSFSRRRKIEGRRVDRRARTFDEFRRRSFSLGAPIPRPDAEKRREEFGLAVGEVRRWTSADWPIVVRAEEDRRTANADPFLLRASTVEKPNDFPPRSIPNRTR